MPTTYAQSLNWRAYYTLCKPRVVMLMLITSLVGMLLATPGFVAWQVLLFGNLGIGLAACCGGVLNHLIDRRIDAVMHRTRARPLAVGALSASKALTFAAMLGFSGLSLLIIYTNVTTALLTFFALIGYAVVYTVYLKRATAQNIVIGGLAGAMPPLLGWTAVTAHIDYAGILLVLIIFIWTPAHFWPLCLYRPEDYQKVNIPMLPVIFGPEFTKLNVLLYTCLLIAVSLLPYIIAMSGLVYLIGALILGAGFLYWALKLFFADDRKVAMITFHYSNFYLMTLFVLLLVDHYV